MYKKFLVLPILTFLLISCKPTSNNRFNVLDFGAIDDGSQITTTHIQAAIDACNQMGGGEVYLPAGEFLVGTLNLRSNVSFYMETGSQLTATTDLSQYQKHNTELAGVFYTEGAENVSIVGNGAIFGQGMEFLYQDSAKVIGDKSRTRQGDEFRRLESGCGDGPFYAKDRFHQMIVFSDCKGVNLKSFKCIDAPYWTFLLVHCEDIICDGLRIDNNLNIPNSDGLDIISCSNATISNCIFSCGDDALVLAGYGTHYGDPGFKNIMKRSENINVSNCVLRSRSSAIRIGGWDQNHMANYNFSNITIYDSNRGINISVGDSGSLQNVNFSNIRIETRLHTGDWWGQGDPIKITAMEGVPGNPVGIIKNINFTNVSCRSENCINLYASHITSIENVFFTNLQMEMVASALEKSCGGNLDLRPNTVPGMDIFARDIPAIYIENGKNIFFDQLSVEWDPAIKEKHYTHAIEAIEVEDLRISNATLSSSLANPSLPTVSTTRCTSVHLPF